MIRIARSLQPVNLIKRLTKCCSISHNIKILGSPPHPTHEQIKVDRQEHRPKLFSDLQEPTTIAFPDRLKLVAEACAVLKSLPTALIDSLCEAMWCYDGQNQKLSMAAYKNVQQRLKGAQMSSNTQDIFKSLQTICHFYNDAEIGLLKGDLHSYAIEYISNFITKMLNQAPKQELTDIQHEIYSQIFNIVTTPTNFRLPLRGILPGMVDSNRNLYQRQLALEKQSHNLALIEHRQLTKNMQDMSKTHELKLAQKYIKQWFPQILSLVEVQLEHCRGQKLMGDRRLYSEHLLKLTADKIATITLNETMKVILEQVHEVMKGGEEKHNVIGGQIKAYKLFERIGDQIMGQIIYENEQKQFLQRQKEIQQKLIEKKKKEEQKVSQQKVTSEAANQPSEAKPEQPQKKIWKMSPMSQKEYLQKLAMRIGKTPKEAKARMSGIPLPVKSTIGCLLVYIFKSAIKFRNSYGFQVPLITSQNRAVKKDRIETILMVNHEFIMEMIGLLNYTNNDSIHMDRSLPTIVEPAPWVDYEIGGYYLRPTSIMRYSQCRQQTRLMKYGDISRASLILDKLSKVAWRINPKVYEVVSAIWSNGGGKCAIPPRYYDMSTYVYQYQVDEERDFEKKNALKKRMQEQRDIHSLRCDFLLKFQVASSYLPLDKFYFPNNFDFRGRVYPIPPHLNHIGADISRGLLMFSQAKRLGRDGVKWLKIHTANLMGNDKARIHQKIQFVDANIDIIDSMAQDPLKNNQWMKYEDCWQALASIFDLSAALKLPNPQDYISHLHIHQDGSCNGLQHYAALGRDPQGAAQVNLDVLDKPGDVYSHVARMVSEMIEADCNNVTAPYHALALKLRGNIKRKTVKQTVMTSVYGVTFIGARQQIYRQIQDQAFLDSEKQEYAASIYVAKCTMQCIKNLFSRAHTIKRWLIECAGIVSSTNNLVGWITPLGLPVVQPYRSLNKRQFNVTTVYHDLNVNQTDDDLPVNKMKQRSAFPPNFVHSLDSTHMMYTASRCFDEGMTFASVHDSYWTHACDVERMNQILREEFIRLHSQPLLERLKESFEKRYPELKFPDVPQRGSFDLQKIKKSLYFFS